MKLEIKNLYGFDDAEVNLPPGPVMITGKNSAGKTSIAKIMAALLSHDDNPSHIAATQKKSYIKDGNADGYAVLDEVKWQPGSAGISAPANVKPAASKHAVGLVPFTGYQRSQAQRAALWEDLVLPDNPRELLESRWTLPSKQLEAVLDAIEKSDWQTAAKMYEDQRRDQKRRWQEITGETYGAKKAASWTPNNWTPELDGASEEELMAELVNAKDNLTMITSVQAVSASQIEDARHIRDAILPVHEKELEGLQKKASEMEAKRNEMDVKLTTGRKKIREVDEWMENAKKQIEAIPPYHCPKCNTGLDFKANRVVEWQKPSDERIKDLVAKTEEYKPKLLTLKDEIAGLSSDLDLLKQRYSSVYSELNEKKGEITGLRKQAKHADAQVAEAADETQRTAAETLVRTRGQLLDAFKAKEQAQQIHDNVVLLDEVCSLLGPNGARATHLEQNLDSMRLVLDKVVKVTGWLPIRIETDYSVTSNGRPIQLCAKNEQLKAQWALQFASAYYARDKWLILDEADTLRDESWEGLISLVNSVCSKNPELRVLVCATSAHVGDWTEVNLSGNA